MIRRWSDLLIFSRAIKFNLFFLLLLIFRCTYFSIGFFMDFVVNLYLHLVSYWVRWYYLLSWHSYHGQFILELSFGQSILIRWRSSSFAAFMFGLLASPLHFYCS